MAVTATELPAGTTLEVVGINVIVDSDNHVSGVGIGYHLRLPSGRLLPSGYTWNPPPKRARQLQRLVDELLEAAREHEGV